LESCGHTEVKKINWKNGGEGSTMKLSGLVRRKRRVSGGENKISARIQLIPV